METHLQRKRIYLETEIKNFEDNNGNFNIMKRKIIFHRLSFLFLIYSFILAYSFPVSDKYDS